MDTTTSGARRISEDAARAVSAAGARRDATQPAVPRTFVSICATLVLAGFIMAGILAVGNMRPIPGYAYFGSAFFGLTFAAFLVAAANLAISDSRRQHDGH
jgi:hypothetical protein